MDCGNIGASFEVLKSGNGSTEGSDRGDEAGQFSTDPNLVFAKYLMMDSTAHCNLYTK